MAITDVGITRVYDCTNDKCGTKLSFSETCGDPWRKVCPLCHKHSLVLDYADLNMSVLIDSNNPKTLGMMGQINNARRERDEGIKKKSKPFWRSSDKINFNILKDPHNFISTGKV